LINRNFCSSSQDRKICRILVPALQLLFL